MNKLGRGKRDLHEPHQNLTSWEGGKRESRTSANHEPKRAPACFEHNNQGIIFEDHGLFSRSVIRIGGGALRSWLLRFVIRACPLPYLLDSGGFA